jgi:ribonuclease HII
MPWVVGIDEAGYGPNLGPLVQAAVAFHLPEGDQSGWDSLRSVARRCRDEADERLLIDDSKIVYPRHGIAALERAVASALALMEPTVGAVLRRGTLSGTGMGEALAGELWYDPVQATPVAVTAEEIQLASNRFHGGLADEVGVAISESVIVPTCQFNRICDEYGSKAAVLARGLAELIPATLRGLRCDGEPVVIHCDKHGGRNFYAAMLQEVFPSGWIVPVRETADESRYRVEFYDRPITVIFRPRADAESIAVALSSMLCKYLRELCMLQFNRFWAKQVRGIKPTAGYPGDARRFFDEIQPVMTDLGLTEDQVWRKR